VLSGDAGEDAAEALLDSVANDSSPAVRSTAIAGLMRCADPRAAPILTAALTDRFSIVRRWAADILGKLLASLAGPDFSAAVDGLSKSLGDSDDWVRLRAASALLARVPRARQVLEALRDTARESAIRSAAREALRGPA
jgi:HEAT repeat protein